MCPDGSACSARWVAASSHEPGITRLIAMYLEREGFQVLSMLKLDEETRQIPVLTYTTEYDGPETIEETAEPSESEMFAASKATGSNASAPARSSDPFRRSIPDRLSASALTGSPPRRSSCERRSTSIGSTPVRRHWIAIRHIQRRRRLASLNAHGSPAARAAR